VEYHVEGGLDWSGNWKKRSDGSVKKNNSLTDGTLCPYLIQLRKKDENNAFS
jgi:hypothetical protein